MKGTDAAPKRQKVVMGKEGISQRINIRTETAKSPKERSSSLFGLCQSRVRDFTTCDLLV
jgi:hypothetical protein